MSHPTQIVQLNWRDNSLAFRATRASYRFHYRHREVWFEFGGEAYHDVDAPALARQLVSAGLSDGTVGWRENSYGVLQRCESLHALSLLTCGVSSLRDYRLKPAMQTPNRSGMRPDILLYMEVVAPASRFLKIRSYRFGVGQSRAHKAVSLVAEFASEADEVFLTMCA